MDEYNVKKIEDFEKIAKDSGLKGKWVDRYGKFMYRGFVKRGFGVDKYYASEWVRRFEKGQNEETFGRAKDIMEAPQAYMDGTTSKVYKKILNDEK